MTDLQPAGTAERAGMLFAELRAWKADSEKRGIPEIIAEIHRDRLWLALNYPTWEAACDAVLGGLRVQLPRDDRREIAAVLHHDQGLSTRAIGTALGVSKDTVHRDLAGVANETPEPTSVTGLDGKTYTRKPITYIGLDPEDDVPDDEVESLVQDFINGGAEVRAAKERARFSKWLYAIHQHHLFDAEDIASIYPERADDVEASLNGITAWATEYLNHINSQHTLRVIPGESL